MTILHYTRYCLYDDYNFVREVNSIAVNLYGHDTAGRLTAVTDGYNRAVSYEYTPAGRRSKLTWPDGFYVTYGYNEVGRLSAIYNSNDSLLWSCAYDSAGRRTQTTGVYGLTTDYDYEDIDTENNDNRGIYLESLTHTLGANVLSFGYGRDLVGNITTELSEGTEISYLYDKNYSLTAVDYETGDDLLYDYDNLFSRVMTTEGSTTTNYTNYTNGLNQYASVDSVNLTYDDNGNLTQHGTKHYLYDAENQMIAYYNMSGEPNSTAVSLYSHDIFGRRTSKSSAVGVGSTTGVISQSYLYDGFQIIGEYTVDRQHIKRRFIYAVGIDEPVCMVVEPEHQGWYGLNEFSVIATSWLCDANDICYDANADYNTDDIIDLDDLFAFLSSNYYLEERPLLESAKYYGYVFDGTGSVVAITYRNDPNQTGNPNELPYFVETYTYDPFGTPTIYDSTGQPLAQSAIGNPYMFTAREYDPESGLYYYRLRMYSPTLGRFMQTDPIGYYDSMNLYQYCMNNPVNFVDPLGLRAISKYPTARMSEGDFQSYMNMVRYRLISQQAFSVGTYLTWDSQLYNCQRLNETQFYHDGKTAFGYEMNYYAMGMLMNARGWSVGGAYAFVFMWNMMYPENWLDLAFSFDDFVTTMDNKYHYFNRGYLENNISKIPLNRSNDPDDLPAYPFPF